MKKRGLDVSLLDEVVDTLRQGKQLSRKYRDHVLSGDFSGFHECHIKPDWLLVYLPFLLEKILFGFFYRYPTNANTS